MGKITQEQFDELLGTIVNNAIECYNPDGEWEPPSSEAKAAYAILAALVCEPTKESNNE